MSLFDSFKKLFGVGSRSKPVTDAPRPESPIPLDSAAESAAQSAADAAAAEASRRFRERRDQPRAEVPIGVRVLVIDDSPTICALLCKMLEQNGYDAYSAGDAESGISLAFDNPPELIFLDIVLPGMNGFEALRRLRRDPRTRGIPIIMISGNEQAVEQFYAERIGADDFMKKPFARSEVFTRINNLLDDHQVPQRRQRSSSKTAETDVETDH